MITIIAAQTGAEFKRQQGIFDPFLSLLYTHQDQRRYDHRSSCAQRRDLLALFTLHGLQYSTPPAATLVSLLARRRREEINARTITGTIAVVAGTAGIALGR